jgi:hypothetical protein
VRFVGRFLLSLLYIVGSVVTVVLALRQGYANAGIEGKTAIIGLVLLAGALLVVTVLQQFHFGRKAQYVKMIRPLTRALSDLQETASHTGSSLDEIRTACKRVVNHLADAFTQLTGRPCSACIKVIAPERRAARGEPTRLKVSTLCRNDTSEEREDPSRGGAHWLDQNTDFEDLFARKNRCFFENCIPWLRDYKNSSFSVHGQPLKVGVPVVGDIIRYIWWPLPYRSAVVSAIIPNPNRGSSDSEAPQTVVGYLCVDCGSAWAFSRPHDIEIITGIAECLYVIVRSYQTKRSELNRRRLR